MDPRWYENFFQGITLDLWREAVSPEQTRAEAGFLERELGLRPGARVLDVPCGFGRHSVELASRGYRVTGVDFSRDMLEEARKRAASARLEIEWRRADMRDLPWDAELDGAFCLGNSFGYLDAEGTRAFVRAVARSLKPGGRFVLDTGLAAESILPRLREKEWMHVGNILFLEENRYHPSEGCMETKYTYVRRGETETQTGFHWVFTLREIRSLLFEAGFEPENQYRSLEREPFQVASPSLLLVARKR